MLGENSSKALSELSSRQLRCAKEKGRAYDGQVHLDSQPQPTVKPMIRMALPDYSVITRGPLFVLNLDRIPASGLPASDFNSHRAISPSGTLGRYGTDGWLPRVTTFYYLPAMAGVCAKQTLLRDSGAAQSIEADFGILMKDAIPGHGGWSQIVARWIVDVKS